LSKKQEIQTHLEGFHPMTSYPKKLIEVALPLEAINTASAYEKSIRHGHPSTLHQWWSRKPLATARAVIFAQMVDDPSEYVNELLADPAKRRFAEKAYREQTKAWEERKTIYNKAHASGITTSSNPEPGNHPRLEEAVAALERQRLFQIIEELVKWENTSNENILQQAREEIWRSWRRTCAENADHPRAKELIDPFKLPTFHDPFAGGGSLPLEAQRLGLESFASDLNPVAVLINKAMIEIPPKFAGQSPVNPAVRNQKQLITQTWDGALGLVDDIHYYGQWMRTEAEKVIGHLYPKVEVTTQMVRQRPDLKPYEGQKLTVIAWLWARTVKSPNPAFAHVDVPLANTFMLATKPGKEAYIQPIIENGSYRFSVKVGKPKDEESAKNGTKMTRGANFKCLMSGTPISSKYIYSEAKAGRMISRLMGIVSEGKRERVYLAPTPEMESIALSVQPKWKPELAMPDNPRWFSPPLYGLETYGDLFSSRQLVALTTFCDLIEKVREKVKHDALAKGISDDHKPLSIGGSGATAYADALGVYLAFAIDKSTVYWNTLCPWLNQPKNEIVGNSFSRQALPMMWGYAEANPFSESGGNIEKQLDYIIKAVQSGAVTSRNGFATQSDIVNPLSMATSIISTDPPYYDNIGYADLSDFFYVWLRRSQKTVFPELFATLAVPKAEELVATPYRHGGKDKAEKFFLDGMTKAMQRLAEQSHPFFPVTIYYAFKQTESNDEGTASTGWDTFLDAVICAGFGISGTWPMRTERQGRMNAFDTNSLVSSIVLVCRKRPIDSPITTRREFISALKSELPTALAYLQASNIAPVDLAQAVIGPGMAVYTRYSKVLDAQGQPLSVHQALALINQTLDETLAEQEGDFDADTRWALAWFEQSGFTEGEYGVAETLSKAKDTSVAGMVEAGILTSGRGKVRLLKPAELPEDWDPNTDRRLTTWEMVHQLIRVLEKDGESGTAQLMAKLGAKAETARELCYRLYTLCERKKRATEALSYNALVQSWPEAIRLARESKLPSETQATLF
jgi:putative DNA methylase